jgi:hypothetical protein
MGGKDMQKAESLHPEEVTISAESGPIFATLWNKSNASSSDPGQPDTPPPSTLLVLTFTPSCT